MKKRKFDLVEEYKKSWNFIKKSRNFIYAVISIFLLTTLLGFFIPLPESVIDQILKFIRELLEKTQGMSQLELIGFIFSNNLQSSFIGIASGIFLGIFPVMAVIANGFILGFVASISVNAEGFFILWRILPHGIFELPAIFISFGLGLKIGSFIFQKRKFESLIDYTFNSLRVFVFVVLPLLSIAAIIEGTLIFLLS